MVLKLIKVDKILYSQIFSLYEEIEDKTFKNGAGGLSDFSNSEESFRGVIFTFFRFFTPKF